MHVAIGLIVAYAIVQNFGCAALLVWLARRHPSSPQRIGIAAFSWAALMSGLFVAEVFVSPAWKSFMREWLYLPMAVEMTWNLLVLQVLFPSSF